jgi:hypothetical protein
LPLQSYLLGDVSSLGLGCLVIAVRTGGMIRSFLHNELHVLKNAFQLMPP